MRWLIQTLSRVKPNFKASSMMRCDERLQSLLTFYQLTAVSKLSAATKC